MEGHILASTALKYNKGLHTPRLAEIFESAWQIVYKSPPTHKKFFRVPMGIFKSKIRSWSLPQIIINYYSIIINKKYNYISNNGFLEECYK